MFVKYSHNAYFSLIGSIVFYINHTYKGKVSRDILLCWLEFSYCELFINSFRNVIRCKIVVYKYYLNYVSCNKYVFCTLMLFIDTRKHKDVRYVFIYIQYSRSFCLSVTDCRSVGWSVRPSVSVNSSRLSDCLTFRPSVCHSVCLSLWRSVVQLVCPSVSLRHLESVHCSVDPSVSPTLRFPTNKSSLQQLVISYIRQDTIRICCIQQMT